MSVNEVTFKSKGAPCVISSAPSTTSIIVVNTYSQNASGSVSIGPSGCDSGRDSRTKEVECLWNSINITKFIPSQFRSALDLLREALSCYQNGAYMAACIMCRTATESLLYIAVNSKYDSISGEITLTPPINQKSGKPLLQVKYDKLLKDAARYLDYNAKKWLSKDLDPNDPETGIIRHSGDFVAHYSEKILVELSSIASTIPKELWKNESSTLEILKKTVLVLQTANDGYKSLNNIP